MSENTKIEWCDHTFNPWVGCTQIGPGCDNCYAKAFDRRFAVSGHAMHWGTGVARKRTSIANWKTPVKWNRKAQMLQRAWQIGVDLHDGDESACIDSGFIKPVRPKVFCASLADVFDNHIDPVWQQDLAALIYDTPNLDWLLLTKRIGNASEILSEMFLEPRKNVWLGATICNQAEADRDIPKLLAVPAHKRFLSMEPLLGPIDLGFDLPWRTPHVDWVIVGGESGHNARAMLPHWAIGLRDQCQEAGVLFLFKQWGEWAPVGENAMERIGKKAAGRLLDGREWNEVPV